MTRKRERSTSEPAQGQANKDEPGALIAFIRLLRGWRQNKLARKAGIDKSRVSRYESGEYIPTPATMARLLGAGGLRSSLVRPISSFIGLIRWAMANEELSEQRTERAMRPVEEVQGVVRDIVDRSVSFMRLELDVLWAVRGSRELLPPTDADRRRVDELVEQLRSFDPKKRMFLVENSIAYKDWLLCVRLCDESERAAANSAQEALDWASLACALARQIPGPDAWRRRIRGFTEHFLANAFRVSNQNETARETFGRGRHLWKAGDDTSRLLDEGRLIDLEASLYRAQGQFSEALRCHNEAFEISKAGQRGVILLNKAATLEAKCDYEGAIQVLEQASPLILLCQTGTSGKAAEQWRRKYLSSALSGCGELAVEKG